MFITFGEEIIEAIFQRGAFSREATSLTAHALLLYSFGILFYGLNPLLRIVLFAFKESLNLLKVSLVGLFANLLLDFMLMRFLGYGGIALATSLVAVIMASYLFTLLRHRLGHPLAKAVFSEIAKPLGAAVSTFIILKIVHSAFMQSLEWDGLFSLVLLWVTGTAFYICFYSILNLRQKLKTG
jgi:putative peptidoglycan lipid II flippase